MPTPDPATPGPYRELGPVATALGIPYSGAPELRVSRGGVNVTLSLHIDSGSVTGLDLHAAREGLPEMTLRRETDHDRRGKEQGINVEAQTGDAVFDARVYIETDLPDEAARALLAAPATRAAILTLLDACRDVQLSSRGVEVTAHGGADIFQPARALPLIDALLAVAAVPRVHVPPGATPPRRGFGLVLLTLAAVPLAIAAVSFTHAMYEPEGPWLSTLGFAVGSASWLGARPLINRYVRGHSQSLSYSRIATALSFLSLPLFGMALAVALNGALDGSTPDRRTGRLLSTRSFVDDGEPKIDAMVEWSNGDRSQHDIPDPGHQLREGDPVVFVRRKGLLGFPWIQQALTATPSGGGKRR